MFDGIEHATLFCPDLEVALRLYRDHLGFTAVDRTTVDAGSAYHRLWRLPDGPLHIVTLVKPASAGGGLRLVGVPSLPPPPGPRSMSSPGPFALDLYVRDLRGLHRDLSDSGYAFRSEPVSYELFGTGFAVDEVLLEAPLGFVHALVEYLPDRHRCVLSAAPEERVSEIVAAITVVEEVDTALATLEGALRGQVYLDEVFCGPAVEELIGLPTGSSFRAVLLRGPARRNARAEVMGTVPGAAPDAGRHHPYLMLSMHLDDLSRALGALPPGDEVEGPEILRGGPHDGRRVAVVWTGWGAVLELVERQ